MERTPPSGTDDLVIQLAALDAALSARVLDASRRAVDAPIRARDGYVYQHLLAGPLSISELGRRLGVSQQAASKQVADLEVRGLVLVDEDPADRRSRRVGLAPDALAVIEAARRERRRLADAVEEVLGPTAARSLQRSIRKLGGHFGADGIIEGRRFVEDDAR